MTLLNITLAPKRVVILTDTLSLNGAANPIVPGWYGTKVHAYPHVGYCIVGRGWAAAVGGAAKAFTEGMLPDDIEHAATLLPEVLLAAEETALADPLVAGSGRVEALKQVGATVHLVGWSARAGRMLGFSFDYAKRYKSEPMKSGTTYHPNIAHVPAGTPLWTIAKAQQAGSIQLTGLDSIGGHLLQHEIIPGADGDLPIITIRSHGKFPRYDEMRAAMGDLSKPLGDAGFIERAKQLAEGRDIGATSTVKG